MTETDIGNDLDSVSYSLNSTREPRQGETADCTTGKEAYRSRGGILKDNVIERMGQNTRVDVFVRPQGFIGTEEEFTRLLESFLNVLGNELRVAYIIDTTRVYQGIAPDVFYP